MKYVSLDIETTCLKPHPDHILGLSVVIEDSDFPEIPVEDLPHLTVIINQPVITGQAYALGLNSWILDFISGRQKDCPYPIIKPSELHPLLVSFMSEQFPDNYKNPWSPKKVTLAGKNVASFDYQFLPPEIQNMFAHRMIDPGSVCIDWKESKPLDLGSLLKRAGYSHDVSHDMLEDARDVIRVLRKTY